MIKKMILRGLIGVPIGITISYLITIIISICIGKGIYYPVTDELISLMGNELDALILQTIISALMGAGFSMLSIIWEINSWSLFKQSAIFFGSSCLLMFPAAYLLNWMSHTAIGILIYVGIFILIFVIIWLSYYFYMKNKIKKMNSKINNNNN